MRVFAVIPAYEEAVRLPSVLDAIIPLVEGVVVVDDGSLDGTAESAKRPGVHVLRHVFNRGQGASLRTGTKAALELGADIIVHLDADGQHDPAPMHTLIEPILRGEVDIVLGSRFLGMQPEGVPLVRCALHIGIRQFNRWVLAIPPTLTDPQSGFRVLSAEAARALVFHQDRMAHASELLRLITRSSFRWKEMPIHVRYSSDTLAKGQKTTDAFRVAWQLVLGMFHRV